MWERSIEKPRAYIVPIDKEYSKTGTEAGIKIPRSQFFAPFIAFMKDSIEIMLYQVIFLFVQGSVHK